MRAYICHLFQNSELVSLWILYLSMNFFEVFQPDHHTNQDLYKGKGHQLKGQGSLKLIDTV